MTGTDAIAIEASEVIREFRVEGHGRGRFRAVDGVSLRVNVGETFGIVGESGSGKTTLARMMAALLRPTKGEVRLYGKRIDHHSERVLRGLRNTLQYVYQDPGASLNPRWTVGRIVAEPLVIHTDLGKAERLARVAAILEAVRLPMALAERYPHELSGGQQRRVGLARILILDPEIIVFDEPTVGLDVSVQAAFLNVLDDLKSTFNLTYVVVSHDLGVIETICDRVAVLYAGTLVEEGRADRLLAASHHPYTAELALSLPRIEGPKVVDTVALRDVDALAIRTEGCPFHGRCNGAGDICRREKPQLATFGGARAACHYPLHAPPGP